MAKVTPSCRAFNSFAFVEYIQFYNISWQQFIYVGVKTPSKHFQLGKVPVKQKSGRNPRRSGGTGESGDKGSRKGNENNNRGNTTYTEYHYDSEEGSDDESEHRHNHHKPHRGSSVPASSSTGSGYHSYNDRTDNNNNNTSFSTQSVRPDSSRYYMEQHKNPHSHHKIQRDSHNFSHNHHHHNNNNNYTESEGRPYQYRQDGSSSSSSGGGGIYSSFNHSDNNHTYINCNRTVTNPNVPKYVTFTQQHSTHPEITITTHIMKGGQHSRGMPLVASPTDERVKEIEQLWRGTKPNHTTASSIRPNHNNSTHSASVENDTATAEINESSQTSNTSSTKPSPEYLDKVIGKISFEDALFVSNELHARSIDLDFDMPVDMNTLLSMLAVISVANHEKTDGEENTEDDSAGGEMGK